MVCVCYCVHGVKSEISEISLDTGFYNFSPTLSFCWRRDLWRKRSGVYGSKIAQ